LFFFDGRPPEQVISAFPDCKQSLVSIMSTAIPLREPLERPLPSSSESERAILGSILLDNRLISQAIEMLQVQDFHVPSHRRVFQAMIFLFEHHSEIDPILIAEDLKKDGYLELVGGMVFLSNLSNGLPRVDSIKPYAQVVRGKALLRQLVRTAENIMSEALAEEDEPQNILDHAEQAIFELADARIRKGFEHIKEPAERVLEKAEKVEHRDIVVTGIPTGFRDLNALTAGFQKQDLIVLAARPSMGKTSLALAIAQHAAMEHEAVVGIFSLEMSGEALAMRVMCSEASVNSQNFRTGYLSNEDWTRLGKALGRISDARIFVDDTAAISVLEMRAKARRLATEQRQLDLIIVDYIQLMAGSIGRFESRQQEVSQISRELKALAKELDVPLVALSQLSRAPENRTDHRPQLADLRESGAIEQDADLVAFIYRDEQYQKTEENKNIAELIVAKQRNGPTDTVYLAFLNQFAKFSDLDRETRGAYLSRFDRSKGSPRINRGDDGF
jgi:replicative DNA helicase